MIMPVYTNQPSMLPTNKLTAATLTALAAGAGMEVFRHWAADSAPYLTGPEFTIFAEALAVFVVGYMVPDRPNMLLEDFDR